jgi:hypothetical protein
LFAGCSSCDNASPPSEEKTNNLGTSKCPACGLWETPKGSTRRVNSKLTLSPNKFILNSRYRFGADCNLTSNNLEFHPIEDGNFGVILLKGISAECEKKSMQQIEKHPIAYRLGKYTLMLNSRNIEDLFIRSNVNLPEQQNPILGKWGVLNEGEKAKDYVGKWDKIIDRIWFKKDSYKFGYKTRYIERYIVEDHWVYAILKTGNWNYIYLKDENKIAIGEKIEREMLIVKNNAVFTKIE